MAFCSKANTQTNTQGKASIKQLNKYGSNLPTQTLGSSSVHGRAMFSYFSPTHLVVCTRVFVRLHSVCEGCDKRRSCSERVGATSVAPRYRLEGASGGGLEKMCGRGRTRVEGRDKGCRGPLEEEQTRKHVGSMM